MSPARRRDLSVVGVILAAASILTGLAIALLAAHAHADVPHGIFLVLGLCLLFAGLLIDPVHFLEAFRIARDKSSPTSGDGPQ